MSVLRAVSVFISSTFPYWGLFFGTLALSLFLTPLVREMNRRFGMVDQPSARRINKTPIPRGGGLAVFLSIVIACGVFFLVSDRQTITSGLQDARQFWCLMALAVPLVLLGYADDKFGLPPLVKLFGQIGVALCVNLWLGIGFVGVFHWMPAWLDTCFTVFWIVGAINAFNLIDGLDGLAAGLAVIAVSGMAGALFFIGHPSLTLFHFTFLGALFGFLRYNFNPASVFLGDTGSMYLGYTVSVLPLINRTGDSFLVGVGVPLLAMGVPIFDTVLAILRRMLRAALKREEHKDEGNTHVMTADVDHLHHRLLRKFVSQRKTAVALYGLAAFFVAVGLGAVLLRDRAAALFIVAFVVAVCVVVRDMSRVELWDAGRLLDVVAHERSVVKRRRRAAFAVPLLLLYDLTALSFAWVFTLIVLKIPFTPQCWHTFLPLRVVPVFFMLVFFHGYATVWARAQISNFIRLALAVGLGAAGAVAIIVLLGYNEGRTIAFPVIHALVSFLLLLGGRLIRQILRDTFYFLGARRLADDPDVQRTLVFGAGLRYRAFRRELVRGASSVRRRIVGLVDDDIVLRGKYIGGVRVDGPCSDAKRIVAETQATAVVIACDLPPDRLAAVVGTFRSCGVTVTQFSFNEKEL